MDELIALAGVLGYKINPGASALLLLMYVQASLANNEESFNQRLQLIGSTLTPKEKKQHIVDVEQKRLKGEVLAIEDHYWIDVRELCETLFFLQDPLLYAEILGKVLSIVDFESLFKLTAPDSLKMGEGNPILTRYKATLCLKQEDIDEYFKALLLACQAFNEPMSFIVMHARGYHMVLNFCPEQPSDFKIYYLGASQEYYSALKIKDDLLAFNVFALTAGSSKIPQEKLIERMQEIKLAHSPIQYREPVLFNIFQLAIAASDMELVESTCAKSRLFAQIPLLLNRELPLNYAAMVAGPDILNALLAAGAPAITSNPQGVYPISLAILYGNDAAFDVLLAPSRRILGMANKDGASPIVTALLAHRQDIAWRLFEAALQPVTAFSDTHAASQHLKLMKQELTDDFTALLKSNKPPTTTHNDLMGVACQFGNMAETLSSTDKTDEAKSKAVQAFLNHKAVKSWIAQKDKASWSLFGASVLFSGVAGALSGLFLPALVVPVVIASTATNSRPLTTQVLNYFGFWTSNVQSGAHSLEAAYKPPTS